jgi:hypothetical protein
MKTIILEVPDALDEALEQVATRTSRSYKEVVLDALEGYGQLKSGKRVTSLRQRRPASVGGSIKPLTGEDDLLDEMLNDTRD